MKRRYKPLIFPALFLCALSAYSAYAIFSPVQKKSRMIASIESEKIKIPTTVAAGRGTPPNTLHFNCQSEDQSAEVPSSQVFIKFENCFFYQEQIKLQTTEFKLINQTNQYMAQIFQPSEDVIVTDFIQLAHGENILKFEFSLNSKQKITKTIKIQRINSEIQ